MLLCLGFMTGCNSRKPPIKSQTQTNATATSTPKPPLSTATLPQVSTSLQPLSQTDVSRFVELKRYGQGQISSIKLSPDGQRIAFVSTIGIWLYDRKTMALHAYLDGKAGRVNDIDWAPDSQYLAAANDNGSVQIWDTKSKSIVQIFDKHKEPVLTVEWAPYGNMVASGGRDNIIRVWNASTGREIQSSQGLPGGECRPCSSIFDLSWSPNSDELALITARTARVWNLETNKTQDILNSWIISSVEWSPNGRLLAVDSERGIQLINTDNRDDFSEISTMGNISDISWSNDSKFLAVSGLNGIVLVWDTAKGEKTQVLDGHSTMVNSIEWLPDNKHIMSLTKDEIIWIWDTSTGKLIDTTPLTSLTYVKDISWSPDGHTIAMSNGELLDVSSGDILKNSPKFEGEYSWSPDSSKIAFSKWHEGIIIWDTVADDETLQFAQGKLTSVLSWAPNGNEIAFVSKQDIDSQLILEVWDIDRIKSIHEIPIAGYLWLVNTISWSPDNNLLAIGGNDGLARIYDTTSGEIIKTLHHGSGNVVSLDWLSGGSLIFTASKDNKVTIWDTSTWDVIDSFAPFTDSVQAIEISSDGRYLVTGDRDGTISILDIKTKKQVAVLDGHSASIEAISWSPNGKMIASLSRDGTIRIWGVPDG